MVLPISIGVALQGDGTLKSARPNGTINGARPEGRVAENADFGD